MCKIELLKIIINIFISIFSLLITVCITVRITRQDKNNKYRRNVNNLHQLLTNLDSSIDTKGKDFTSTFFNKLVTDIEKLWRKVVGTKYPKFYTYYSLNYIKTLNEIYDDIIQHENRTTTDPEDDKKLKKLIDYKLHVEIDKEYKFYKEYKEGLSLLDDMIKYFQRYALLVFILLMGLVYVFYITHTKYDAKLNDIKDKQSSKMALDRSFSYYFDSDKTYSLVDTSRFNTSFNYRSKD